MRKRTSPRARGRLCLSVKPRGNISAIADLRQEGSLKALFPHGRRAALQAVFLNTAGGLTGGDRMRIKVSTLHGAKAVISSQAAERAYRATGLQPAHSDVSLHVADGARLDWLPQETILFDGAALRRRLNVTLEGDGSAIVVEPLVFGRAAMGETVRDLRFSDQWRVYHNGELIFADAIRLNGDAHQTLQSVGTGQGMGAFATVLVAGAAASSLPAIDLPPSAGLSQITDNIVLLRFAAKDSFALRKALIPAIEALPGASLPRVWRL